MNQQGSPPSETKKLSKRKKFLFVCTALLITFAVFAVFAEVIIRFVDPQRSLYPRWNYSPEVGSLPFANTKMVHKLAGRWKFTYSINEDGYRGPLVPVRVEYDRHNIVVLGDSYSFGQGVQDGKEYPAVLARELAEDFAVVNLGVPGHGLGQHIRRFYEHGKLYKPKWVILQFCGNDPDDNLYYRVTEAREGRFIFRDWHGVGAFVKRHFSRSVLQKSHLYNFVRQRAVLLLQRNPKSEVVTEQYHIDLLSTFARDLSRQDIRVFMIAVNGELTLFPSIEKAVFELEAEGLLDYVEVLPWFEGVTDYDTPEGHIWGEKGHAIIGARLAEYFLSLDR